MPESHACSFIKKETLAEVFSCEFCEIFKNTFFYKTPLVAASKTAVLVKPNLLVQFYWRAEKVTKIKLARVLVTRFDKFHHFGVP